MLAILIFLKSVNFTDQMVYRSEIKLHLPVNTKTAVEFDRVVIFQWTLHKSLLYFTLYINVTIGQKVKRSFAGVSKNLGQCPIIISFSLPQKPSSWAEVWPDVSLLAREVLCSENFDHKICDRTLIISWIWTLLEINFSIIFAISHCVKNVQIPSFFCFVFSRIQCE